MQNVLRVRLSNMGMRLVTNEEQSPNKPSEAVLR